MEVVVVVVVLVLVVVGGGGGGGDGDGGVGIRSGPQLPNPAMTSSRGNRNPHLLPWRVPGA